MLRRTTKTVNLALQGGGAHGAFTWGVLDRLLEEESLEIEGVTATSAGAMNAAALKTGLVLGGSREAARATLDDFWGTIADYSRGLPNPLLEWVRAVNPTTQNIATAMEVTANWSAMAESLAQLFSPYDVNPLNINPLRGLLSERLDFDAVCRATPPYLFVCATNVRSGKVKIFQGEELSTEAIIASTCLPTLFQAVEIEDPATGRLEAYWDGGYTGNPPLFPLFYNTRSRDIIIAHINPIRREALPRSAREIMNRVNEISFNSSLLQELRSINFVRRLRSEGRLPKRRFKDVLIHSVMDDDVMNQLGVATKMQPDWTLLQNLKQAGRDSMDRFLRDHWDDLNERPSVDLRAMYG